MVRAYLTSEPGTTMGLGRIMAAIDNYLDQLLVVIRVQHPNRYTFIAVFRESVGQFTALINQGGATVGYSGGGPYAHAAMLTYLESKEIDLEESYWSDWESDYPYFTSEITKLDNAGAPPNELAMVWSDFLSDYIWHFAPSLDCTPSDEYLRRVGHNE